MSEPAVYRYLAVSEPAVYRYLAVSEPAFYRYLAVSDPVFYPAFYRCLVVSAMVWYFLNGTVSVMMMAATATMNFGLETSVSTTWSA